ncbi:hypothetical protein M422DRAFT_782450 [Sphaerobolus stellatus SS14]|uniref:Telomere length regulation protein conserved domain-containing protein n=1 Tax=Sphaerobolus stellatus (strain SS14) TaxID=990650 RepID=A0A0C9VED0_SPHS4|nr:hypothetical protein M422DRAFT_782450 [Sphaerobolus stellatus SS14]
MDISLSLSHPRNGDSSTATSPVHQYLFQLRTPVESLESLEQLLLEPLTALNVVPHGFKPATHVSLQPSEVLKIIPTIQDIILNNILPTWFLPIQEAGHKTLLKQLFCPSLSQSKKPIVKILSESQTAEFSKISVSGLTTLISLDCQVGRDTSTPARRKVGENARILRGIFGKLVAGKEDDELWGAITAIVCGSGRIWDFAIARAVVSWVADLQDSKVDEAALRKLLDTTMVLWTNPEHIRHALLSQHRYTTSLVLIILAAMPSPPMHLALSSPFISSITTYLTHLDDSIRRCGMLTAEIVATRCGQKLAFEGWEAKGDIFDWARVMRGWKNDWDVEGFQEDSDIAQEEEMRDEAELEEKKEKRTPERAPPDSDDESMSGYSSEDSSRPPSPTNEEMDEFERDPTLRVGRSKPIPRPFYLPQLIELLRSDKDDKEAVERVEIALSNAEGLIRRKKGFGLELEENAAELTMALTRLRNTYDLETFDENRQGALIALIECCPRQTAQTLIEQFFTNQYTTHDRITFLTSLAIGARSLAGLPVPPSSVPRAPQFPSKMLPPALHRRYATPEEHQLVGEEGSVQKMLGGITKGLLEESKEEAEEAVKGHPDVVRQKMLRLGTSKKGLGRVGIQEVSSSGSSLSKPSKAIPKPNPDAYTAIAAEHFIMPLINHMWMHLRDASTRTGRGGTGTDVIFDVLVLSQFVGTLGVLVYAARFSPTFLAVIAPAALEMGLTLGNRRVSMAEISSTQNSASTSNSTPNASLLLSSLSLTHIILSGSVSLDSGRTLALEHTVLLKAAGAWAGEVLDAVERGRKVEGGGGAVETRLGAAAAGVVIGVEKVTGKWGGGMGGF